MNSEDAPKYLDSSGQAVAPGLLVRDVGCYRPLTLDELYVLQVRFVMEFCKGNKTVASRLLKVDRRTLYRILDRLSGKPKRSTREVIGADDAAPDAPDEPRTAVL